MAATIKYGDTKWAVKDGNTLGYNDENRFKPVPFDFTRNSIGTRVDRNGLIETIGNNIPRIDFTDNPDGHLLLEPQSTNLITYSEDFTEYLISTTNLDTPTIVSVTNPTGVNSAGLLNINNGVSASKFIYLAISTSSSIHTQSIFVKYVDRQWIQLLSGGTSHYANFDIQNGVVGNTSGCSSTIEDYGNGWYRCTATLDSAATPINLAIAVIDDNTAIRLSASTGIGSYNLWGSQVEALSYATSYIPTNGSTVTRDAETCTNAGNSTLINSTEGVLYAEIAALADDGTSRTISLSSGSTSNRVFIQFRSTSGQVNSGIVVSNSAQAVISHTITQTQYIKMAFKYKADDFALWVNGVEVGTDTSGTTFTANTLTELNFDSGSGAEDFYGKCKALTVFNTALTDAELTELTS